MNTTAEAVAFQDFTGYSVEEIFSIRGICAEDVRLAEIDGTSICVKVPSASEAYVSTALAREILGLEAF